MSARDHAGDRPSDRAGDHEGLLALLRRFTRTLLGEYSLMEVLEGLGPDICRILGVDGAGVMFEDERGDLRFVSASDHRLTVLESLQIELGEGPCLQAYREAREVLTDDIADDDRFPGFGTKAAEAGLASVHSFPLLHQGSAIGALNLYTVEPGALTEDQREAGRTLADVATAYVVHARDDEAARVLNRQLQHAVDSRVVIEQAKGYLAARRGTTPDTALEVLRGYARSRQRKLRDVASGVVTGEIRIEELGGGRRDPGPP